MAMNPREAAFRKAIRSTPLDGALRLVYADWLEDQGRAQEAATQRWLGRTLDTPYDPDLRHQFALWLDEQGRREDCWLQLWMEHALRGWYHADLVFTPQGVLPQASTDWDGLRKQTQNYWRKTTDHYFRIYRGVLFIVITPLAPTYAGFRRNGSYDAGQGDSPLLWWRRGVGSKARVLPRFRLRRPQANVVG